MVRALRIIILLGYMVTSCVTYAAQSSTALDDKKIAIATGPLSGIYFPVGDAVCRVLNKERRVIDLRCNVLPTPGSVYNLDALKNSIVDIAIVQADWEEHAYNGTGIFMEKGRFEKLRHMFSLYTEAITIIVPKYSSIRKLDDLKGRVLNVGLPGSGGRETMNDIMKAKGWTNADFKGLASADASEQIQGLCGGSIDAIVLAIGHPNPIVQSIASACEIRFVPINDPIIDKFIEGNPEFARTVLPGGMYNGIPNNTETFGVKASIVTTTDMSEDNIYKIVKTIFENVEVLKAMQPNLKRLDKVRMVREGRTAPLHDGAKKYFEEQKLE